MRQRPLWSSEVVTMSKLFVLKKKDEASLRITASLSGKDEEIAVVMMLDAVYMAADGGDHAEAMKQCFESGVRVYVLEKDADRRGIIDRLIEGAQTVDYPRLIDLFYSEGQTVINL